MKGRLYLPLLHCFPSTLLRAGFVTLLITALAKPAIAIYDPTSVANNRFGIHILFPEEIDNAAKLINSSGGNWGYVTIPIQSVDRNIEKWQKFLDDCKDLHVIPIIRLATFPLGPVWTKPSTFDSLDWANFLNSLSWPIKNRYIIVYNEVNRAQEWGNELRPDEYASILADTYDALKRINEDFFVLNAGLDAAAPNNHELMNEYEYLTAMNDSYPDIFRKIDGWNSHSYPNPAFSNHPYSYSSMGIRAYQHELTFIQNNFGVYGLPVFITETGWTKNNLSEEKISQYYQLAFSEIWIDSYLTAITPFLLTASGQFSDFCWLSPDKGESLFYKNVCLVKKIKGEPKISSNLKNITNKAKLNSNINQNKGVNSKWSGFKSNLWEKVIHWIFK